MEEDVEKIERFILSSKKTFGEATELAFAWRRIKDRYRELEEREIWSTATINGLKREFIPKSKIKEIRDKAEVMDYYTLNNVIDDLTKLLGDEKQWKKYGET